MAGIERDNHNDRGGMIDVPHTAQELAFLYQILDKLQVQGLEGKKMVLGLMERYQEQIQPDILEKIERP